MGILLVLLEVIHLLNTHHFHFQMIAVSLASLMETCTHFYSVVVHVVLQSISISHLAQEMPDFLEAEVEKISDIATDSLSHVEAKLKRRDRSFHILSTS